MGSLAGRKVNLPGRTGMDFGRFALFAFFCTFVSADFPQMKKISLLWLVLAFALLHSLTSFSLRLAGVGDELILSLLTMVLVVLICHRKRLYIEYVASIVIAVNAVGYLLGTEGAKLLALAIPSEVAVHAVSTFLTTQIIGLGTLYVSNVLKRTQKQRDGYWTLDLGYVFVLILVVFLFRMAFVWIFSLGVIGADSFYKILVSLISNIPLLILLVCLNIIFVGAFRRLQARMSRRLALPWRVSIIATFVLLLGVLSSALFFQSLSILIAPEGSERSAVLDFILVSLIASVLEVLVFVVIYVIDLAIASRADIMEEKRKRHKAQFEYLKLKLQVNPHFLFNSLNVLDGLVQEGREVEASEFIHRLAGLYRYMIQNSDQPLVCLHDELTFTNAYSELLRVRYPKGFEVTFTISAEAATRKIVPCTLQMLVENAYKHNVISPEKPLVVDMKVEGEGEDTLVVVNNINPKSASSTSNGHHVGLNYISQQYLDLADKEVKIQSDGQFFKVSIPLL